MLTNEQLKRILEKTDILPAEEFDKFNKEAENKGKNIEEYLMEKKIITSLSLYENAAQYFNVPFVNLKGQTIRKDILYYIPEPIASTHNLIAFSKDDNNIKIAALDTAVDRKLSLRVKNQDLQRYEHKVTSTPTQRVLGQAFIELKLVPAFELREITVTVALAAI